MPKNICEVGKMLNVLILRLIRGLEMAVFEPKIVFLGLLDTLCMTINQQIFNFSESWATKLPYHLEGAQWTYLTQHRFWFKHFV